MGFTENPAFRWGSRKTNIEGRLPKKGGLGQLSDLGEEGGLGKKEEGGVFEGRGTDNPMHTMYHEKKWNVIITAEE